MLLKMSEWLMQAKGKMGEEYYASKAPGRPGWMIARKRPKRHKGEMKDAQAEGVNQFLEKQDRARAEYRDPVKRAQWEAEYKEWRTSERKRGRMGNKLKGKCVRFLWDYVRIRVGEQVDKEKKAEK